ncbi:Uma2 family endonuclease [Bacillus sp. V59.32b]|uniref:Uma2 family endonuclease n=1 Tax=Bacillus sp. V59.32b TaxID=1758642 RepID=UPI0013587BD5|nr:Uma2 family endonuclease [Bacillus sp. V59.32b]
MSSIKPDPKKVTYAEYLTWPDEPRYEVIDGIPHKQSVPSRKHQRIHPANRRTVYPSTWHKDRIEKLNVYQKHGVKEYLLIYPNERVVEQYILTEEDVYGTPFIYKEEDVLRSFVLQGFEVAMIDIFS